MSDRKSIVQYLDQQAKCWEKHNITVSTVWAKAARHVLERRDQVRVDPVGCGYCGGAFPMPCPRCEDDGHANNRERSKAQRRGE